MHFKNEKFIIDFPYGLIEVRNKESSVKKKKQTGPTDLPDVIRKILTRENKFCSGFT